MIFFPNKRIIILLKKNNVKIAEWNYMAKCTNSIVPFSNGILYLSKIWPFNYLQRFHQLRHVTHVPFRVDSSPERAHHSK